MSRWASYDDARDVLERRAAREAERQAKPHARPAGRCPAVGLTPFEAGSILSDLRSVALGAKPAASGYIRFNAKRHFRSLVRRAALPGLRVAFGKRDGPLVMWRASRHEWALKAHEWLDAGGRAALGDFHLHWIQGLLYGYSPEEIAGYLARLAAEEPTGGEPGGGERR